MVGQFVVRSFVLLTPFGYVRCASFRADAAQKLLAVVLWGISGDGEGDVVEVFAFPQTFHWMAQLQKYPLK